MSVNLDAIMSGGDRTTNYQLMPGDRLIVTREPKAEAPDPAAVPPPSAEEVRALKRRVEELERKLDRVIDLLGGLPPAPQARGAEPNPRAEPGPR